MEKKLPKVHCRICKRAIDRNTEKENVDWIMPSRNFYYHKSCYENWKRDTANLQMAKEDDEWIDYIYDFIGRDLKGKYNYLKCESQRKSFIKKYGYTNKGMFFALKYYYEIQNNPWDKAEGGIGIIPYIYNDTCAYWEKRYLKQKDILQVIEKQFLDRMDRPELTVKRKKRQKRYQSKLAEIGEIADEQ